MCGTELGFGCIDLRLSGLLRLRRNLEIGPRRPSLRKKCLLAFVVIARLRQLPLGGRETCLRLPQCVQLVLRFKSCHYLPGLHPVPEFAGILQQPPGNPKRYAYFILSLDAAGKCQRLASLALLNGCGPNWAGCRSCGVYLFLAGRERQCRCDRNKRRHQQSIQFRPAGACRHSKTYELEEIDPDQYFRSGEGPPPSANILSAPADCPDLE